MSSRLDWRIACLALLASSAVADAQGLNSVTVRALTDGQNCNTYRQQMRCDSVGSYLRDNRRLPFSQPIDVIADGAGDASRTRGLNVAHYLKMAGYSKVMVVAFLTQPPSASMYLQNYGRPFVSSEFAKRLAFLVIDEKYPKSMFAVHEPGRVKDNGDSWSVTFDNALVDPADKSWMPKINGGLVPRHLTITIRKTNCEVISIT